MGGKQKSKKQQHHDPQNQHPATNPPKGHICKIPTPLPVRIEPDAKHNEEYREEKESRGAQLRTTKHLNFISAIGVGAAIVYAIITYLQWSDLRRNFMIDERAWLKMEIAFPEKLQDTQIPSRIVNVGKSVALRAETYAGVEIVNSKNPPSFSYKSTMTTSHVQVVFPTSHADITATRYHPEGGAFPLTDSERTDLASGDAYAAVYGLITYQDQFGIHWTRFCHWHAYNNSPNDPTPKFNAESCSDYNAVGEGEGREGLIR